MRLGRDLRSAASVVAGVGALGAAAGGIAASMDNQPTSGIAAGVTRGLAAGAGIGLAKLGFNMGKLGLASSKLAMARKVMGAGTANLGKNFASYANRMTKLSSAVRSGRAGLTRGFGLGGLALAGLGAGAMTYATLPSNMNKTMSSTTLNDRLAYYQRLRELRGR